MPAVAWEHRLDGAPLRRWLRQHRSEERFVRLPDAILRAVYRVLHEQTGVSLRVADRILVAVGECPVTLHELYPLPDEPVVDRWCGQCREIVLATEAHVCPWCESETNPVTHSTGERWVPQAVIGGQS
jgi:RNA polymerase subunit RPABC4/transcription elongation factor Spt4